MHAARLRKTGELGPPQPKWRTAKPGVTTKICGGCLVEKPLEEFYNDSKSSDGHKSHCKACYHKWYETHKEQIKKRKRDHELRTTYGIGLKEYDQILEQQGGKLSLPSRH